MPPKTNEGSDESVPPPMTSPVVPPVEDDDALEEAKAEGPKYVVQITNRKLIPPSFMKDGKVDDAESIRRYVEAKNAPGKTKFRVPGVIIGIKS